MFVVEVYAAVRRYVFVDGNSRRDAARVFGVSRETVTKMCRFSLPPGCTRTMPVVKPKLGALLPVIDAILEAGPERAGPPGVFSFTQQRPSGAKFYKIQN
jgi:hypothetical protein